MTTFVFGIGRNVGSVPMPTAEWAYFTDALEELVAELPMTLVFRGEGVGIFEETSEDSCTIVCVGDALNTFAFSTLTQKLRKLARRFEQESIALTIGETTFVGELDSATAQHVSSHF